MATKTLIVGYGITGKNLEKEIAPLYPDLSDIKQPSLFQNRKYDTYDLIFICVDTPYLNPDTPCDLSAVHSVIIDYKQHLADNGVFVIKSTVPPKTTNKLRYEFGDIIVYSPEYYGNTPHCNNFQFNFTILGGNPHNCIKVQQALHRQHNGGTRQIYGKRLACHEGKFLQPILRNGGTPWRPIRRIARIVHTRPSRQSLSHIHRPPKALLGHPLPQQGRAHNRRNDGRPTPEKRNRLQ